MVNPAQFSVVFAESLRPWAAEAVQPMSAVSVTFPEIRALHVGLAAAGAGRSAPAATGRPKSSKPTTRFITPSTLSLRGFRVGRCFAASPVGKAEMAVTFAPRVSALLGGTSFMSRITARIGSPAMVALDQAVDMAESSVRRGRCGGRWGVAADGARIDPISGGSLLGTLLRSHPMDASEWR